MSSKNSILLGIPVKFKNKSDSLEKILLYLDQSGDFFHIVSLNPEILVTAQKDALFKNILSEGDIQLPDGVGVLLAGSILGIQVQDRIQGVDFMDFILEACNKSSLRVLFLGGKNDLAEQMADRYQNLYPTSKFKGIQGISDILNPTQAEEKAIFSIVADYKPQIIFAAFGSPQQEKWFYSHKDKLKGIVCMGVGGGFDFVTGTVWRAPHIVRVIGLEWLFRLIVQPWRWKRQLKLITFVYLVLRQKFGLYTNSS